MVSGSTAGAEYGVVVTYSPVDFALTALLCVKVGMVFPCTYCARRWFFAFNRVVVELKVFVALFALVKFQVGCDVVTVSKVEYAVHVFVCAVTVHNREDH